MSSYEELEKEFREKVKKLREKCEHEEISDWIEQRWAPGHPTGCEVKICKRCRVIVDKRTRCWLCGSFAEKSKWIESEGKFFCSQKCVEEFKRRNFPPFQVRKESSKIP